MFDINQVNKTKSFEAIKKVKTQVIYYLENNAHPDIIKIVALGNKSFGEKAQRIVMECLSLDKPTETGHDILQESSGLKFEVKASRFWVTTGDWKWQHIMEDHIYDYLLMVGINFNSIDVYVIGKKKFMELKSIGLVTQQGGAGGQGLWCDYRKIKDYLTPINGIDELNNFIALNS